ncbi:MAG: response regulator [Planctomycetota bacterium]
MTEEVRHILVAEDNPAMGIVIRHSLRQAGFEVTLARCGQTAWESLREHDFDLFVCDYLMPGMTGGELCQRMREDSRLARMPVVLLTAKALELDTTLYAEELSVNAIISKPFSPQELTRTIENLLVVAAAGA